MWSDNWSDIMDEKYKVKWSDVKNVLYTYIVILYREFYEILNIKVWKKILYR